jgi:hypothetical protein
LAGSGGDERDEASGNEESFIAKTLIFSLKEAMNFRRESGPTGGLAFAWRSVAPEGFKTRREDGKSVTSLEASFANFNAKDATDRNAKQTLKGNSQVKGKEVGIGGESRAGAEQKTPIAQDAFSRWLRPYQAAGWSFLYVPDGAVTAHTLQFFHLTFVQSLFEAETGRSYEAAETSLFEAMMAGQSLSRLLKAEKMDTQGMAALATYGPAVSFSLYNPKSGLFEPQCANSIATILQPVGSSPVFWLHIEDALNHTLLYHEPIHANATQHVERAAQSFVWCQGTF